MIYRLINIKIFVYLVHFNSVALLNDKNINQYFIDITYKSLPADIDNAKFLLVIIGYNYSKDLFELILVALLNHKDTNIYIFKNNNNIKIIPCFFHLLQCWWKKASSLGLRKKKYIKEIKVIIFNL